MLLCQIRRGRAATEGPRQTKEVHAVVKVEEEGPAEEVSQTPSSQDRHSKRPVRNNEPPPRAEATAMPAQTVMPDASAHALVNLDGAPTAPGGYAQLSIRVHLFHHYERGPCPMHVTQGARPHMQNTTNYAPHQF